MKTLVQRISRISNHDKILEWGRLITITGSAQLVIQAIGFISGILVIRLLSTQEYAYYTLANTMLGTMIILADGGISTAVLSEGGKAWQDPKKLGVILTSAFALRKKFIGFSLIIAMPWLAYLLLQHGASWLIAITIIISLIPSFLMSLSGSLLEVAPRLKQNIVPLQKIQVITAISRLFLLGAFLFSFPWTFTALLASGLPQIYANRSLKRISNRLVDYSQKADRSTQKAMLGIVKRILPGSIYYCISGQVTIWLISYFGSTVALAHMGALSRIGMILGFFTVLFSTLILPRFARLPADFNLLLRRFLQIEIALFIWGILVTSFIWLFSTQILWILGNQYSKLNTEVVLTIAGTCLSLIAGITYTVFTSRGWAIHPVPSILISIISIIFGICYFETSSLQGILLLNIFVATIQTIMNISYCFLKIWAMRKIDS